MRIHTLSVCSAMFGCSDAGIIAAKTPHEDPLVSILSPADGDIVARQLLAEGSVSSPSTPTAALQVEWAVDSAPVCAESTPDSEGFVVCTLELSGLEALLSLTVTDDQRARTRDEVVVYIEETIVSDEDNEPPGPPTVTLSPAAPTSADPLEAIVGEADDPDGDALEHFVRWQRDGVDVPEHTGRTVPADATSRDEAWSVEVWASDGRSDGPPASAGPVTINNAAPEGGMVSIEPAEPWAAEDDLLCRVDAAPVDADADALTYTVHWFVNGAAWTGDTTTNTLPGDEIAGQDTAEDDIWRCEVTAHDGEASGDPLGAEVVVRTCEWYRARDTPFTYGTLTDTRTGRTYRTIVVGSQTWMADNLDFGARVDGVDGLTDNGIDEKWCYGDDNTWCADHGGIYNRSEAIAWTDYTVEGAQGLCPTGWHVPTVDDFERLLTAAGTSRGLVDVCAGDRSGTDTVGFAAGLVGVRSWGNFEREGEITKFWTSTYRGNGGYNHNLVVTLSDSTAAGMWEEGSNPAENGFSVRCIQD